MNAMLTPFETLSALPSSGPATVCKPGSAQTSGSNGAPANASSPARLFISLRSCPDAQAGGWRGMLARLRGLVPGQLLQPPTALTSVQIDDLRGQNFLRMHICPTVIDIRLPPGIYHVTTWRQELRRRYTVTLSQGATIRLPLHMQLRDGQVPKPGVGALSQSHTDQA